MINTTNARRLAGAGMLMAICAIGLVVGTDTAVAGSNSLQIKVPHVTVNVSYRISIRGFAVGSKHLYLFIDTRRCGANPAVETARGGPSGTAAGYYWARVHGQLFKRTGVLRTTGRVTDHACAYLTKSSVAESSPKGVVAHAFEIYTVH